LERVVIRRGNLSKLYYENKSDKNRIEKIYCSLCTFSINNTEPHLQCIHCGRFICDKCLESITQVEMANCPSCNQGLIFQDQYSELRVVSSLIVQGRKFLELSKEDIAEKFFSQATKLDPKSFISWKYLSKIYNKKKNWEKARYSIQKALKLNPHDDELRKLFIEVDFMIRSYY